jgi:opacity protein-like surface antigen
MLNTRTAGMDTDAKVITDFLGTSATVSVKQPANYGAVGVRYKIPMSGRMQPYAGVGIGLAKVSKNVDFAINGNNVNGVLLDTYGVQLGTDLAGSENKALVTFNVGAQIPLMPSVFADISYRFGRVFLTGAGLSTNRLQFGVGMRFK